MNTRKMVMGLAFAFGASFLAAAAMAGGVDGKIDATDGYNEVYSVTWTASDDHDTVFTGGELHLNRNANGKVIQAAVKLPTAFVDNTYGTGSTNGYGHAHTFDELLGSDRLNITMYDANGDPIANPNAGGMGMGADPVEVKLDYIAEVNGGAGYRSAGVLKKDEFLGADKITDKADGEKVAAGDALDLIITEVATSLEANFAMYGLGPVDTSGGVDDGIDLTKNSPSITDADAVDPSDYVVLDPYFSDWEFALIWEFSIDPNELMVSNVLPTDGHASPSRLGGNESLLTPEAELKAIPVPTPAALPAGLIGLSMLMARRRRRR